jgi:Tfp pilus assembly protein PilF
MKTINLNEEFNLVVKNNYGHFHCRQAKDQERL